MTPSNLTNHLIMALAAYYHNNPEVSVCEILESLETIRYDITEEFIKQHPELVWILHKH